MAPCRSDDDDITRLAHTNATAITASVANSFVVAMRARHGILACDEKAYLAAGPPTPPRAPLALLEGFGPLTNTASAIDIPTNGQFSETGVPTTRRLIGTGRAAAPQGSPQILESAEEPRVATIAGEPRHDGR